MVFISSENMKFFRYRQILFSKDLIYYTIPIICNYVLPSPAQTLCTCSWTVHKPKEKCFEEIKILYINKNVLSNPLSASKVELM